MTQIQQFGLFGQNAPTTSGTAGQVLTSAGSGSAAYWGSAAGGGGSGYTGSAGAGYTGSAGTNGYTGSASTVVGYTGSASTTGGYTGSAGAGYTGSAATIAPGYTFSSQFNGSSQYLTTATASISSYDFSNGNYTIEFWMNPSTITTETAILCAGPTSSGALNRGWGLELHNGTSAGLWFYQAGVITSWTNLGSYTANVWQHVAIVRNSTTVTAYVNGTSVGTASSGANTQTAFSAGDIFFIGALYNTGNVGRLFYPGYISNLRIVKGTAVYTSAFTTPTSPLTAISGTSLLTCNAITPSDSSTNNFQITNNGGVTTSAVQSPFASTTVSIPTAALTAVRQQFVGDGTTTVFPIAGGYTANAISVFVNGVLLRNGTEVTVTNGSTIVFAIAPLSGALIDVIGTVPTTYSSITPVSYSASFNGSTQHLSIADSAVLQPGSSNFTAESWVFLTATPPSNGATIISKANASTFGPFWLGINSSSQLLGLASTDGSTWAVVLTGPTISLNTWYHFALVRNGSTFTLYVNGVSVASTTNASALYAGSTYAVMIGKGNYTLSNFTGYISNLRYVVGTAVYTGAFTPPTSPLAAVQSATSTAAAITGTQTSLLTCNGPTIIDGSTNAFTITNNGSAPVSTAIVPTFTNVTITNQTSYYPANYLIIGGGGGAGYSRGGAGGGGGFISDSTTLNIGTTYTITVGAGGTAGTGNPGSPYNTYTEPTIGGSSIISGSNFTKYATAIGGGVGSTSNNSTAGSGGSGGGGFGNNGFGNSGGSPTLASVGSPYIQGNSGGAGGANYGAGGGGGAGSAGSNGSSNNGGNGGNGLASSITGSSVTYAGGGGGGSNSNGTTGTGGTGGGGNGGATSSAAGSNGTANLGGGGGGGRNDANATNGGAGGSGVVIIAVPTVNYSGTTTGSPTVTTNGSYKIITFTASGSYTA